MCVCVSQALDGKVERDEFGKEVRYPVILTAKEKLIARAVSLAFKVSASGFWQCNLFTVVICSLVVQ